MSVISKLVSTTGSKEQTPNIEAAKYIAAHKNTHAIGELIHHLEYNTQKSLRHDCIKTLYEVAYLEPEVIAGQEAEVFITLLRSKDNRIQWGAMTLLSSIATIRSKLLFDHIDEIIRAAKESSVISMGHCVNILVSLCSKKEYQPIVFPAVLNLLKTAPDNQAPSYAEKIAPVITDAYKRSFVDILEKRVQTITPESKRKRISKVMQKLNQ